jgi:hypothetical protein
MSFGNGGAKFGTDASRSKKQLGRDSHAEGTPKEMNKDADLLDSDQ